MPGTSWLKDPTSLPVVGPVIGPIIGPWLAAILRTRLGRTLFEAVKAFLDYQGFSQSAALSFHAMLSFVPLIFLSLSIAGLLYGDSQAVATFLETRVSESVPWLGETLTLALARFSKAAGGLSYLALFFIVYTSGSFFSSLQTSLLLPWAREHDHRKPWWRIVLPWTLGPVVSLSVIVLLFASHAFSYVTASLPGLLALVDRPELTNFVLQLPYATELFSLLPKIWSLLVLAGLVFILYILLLPGRCPMLTTILTSLVIGLASTAVTMFFVTIVVRTPNYALVYGPLAGIILFLLWLNYNMTLILLGAHVIRVSSGGCARRIHKERKRRRLLLPGLRRKSVHGQTRQP